MLIIHQIFSLVRDWSKRVTWANIPHLKLGNILGYSPIFKTDGYINTIAFIWRENMLGYLSADIICSSMLTVFLELRSRKTVRFSEQIMSAHKYPSIFSRQMKAIVYLLTQSYTNFQILSNVIPYSRPTRGATTVWNYLLPSYKKITKSRYWNPFLFC